MGRSFIVDDEKNVTSSFKKILTEEGHEVLTADNAKDALSVAKAKPMDLVIMDIRMPGESGLEAFSKLKELDRKTPIIMMTAEPTPS